MASVAGQIIPRGEGKWVIRVFRGRDAAGKRQYANETVLGTKKDAQRRLTQKLRELDTGTFVEASREAVSAYLDRWLDVWKAPKVRRRTLESYRDVVKRYITPTLGAHRLDRLTPVEIQRLYNELTARGLSARTVRLTHTVLRDALAQAVRTRLLPTNPADVTEPPRKVRREMKALAPKDLAAFFQAAKDDDWYALWVLLATTGLRPGEALGLRWDDIQDRTLRVQRVLVPRSKGASYFEEPKTAKSRRSVPLPDLALAALAQHRRTQAKQKLRAGAAYENQGLVFANPRGKPADYRTLVLSHYKKILKAAKLPELRLYDLRHSSATVLLAAGIHPKIVAERLGHSSVTLTLDTYSHVLPDMQQAASEVFDALPEAPRADQAASQDEAHEGEMRDADAKEGVA